MIKISFEYTLVNSSVVKVEPKITNYPSTIITETIMAEAIKSLTMDMINKSGMIKTPDIQSILSNIGKT